jgi:hypothetical protein
MKLNTIVIAAALALAGSVASAATVGSFKDAVTGAVVTDPEIGPGVYSIFEAAGTGSTTAPATFDYVYNFTLDAASNLNVTGNTYTGPTVSADSAVFNLYMGTSAGTSGAAADKVAGGFSFLGTAIQGATYTNLAAGNYFIELTGTTSSAIGTAFNVTFQAPSATGPLPAIPEPTNMALLLAGLGLMGFMVKRRSSN